MTLIDRLYTHIWTIEKAAYSHNQKALDKAKEDMENDVFKELRELEGLSQSNNNSLDYTEEPLKQLDKSEQEDTKPIKVKKIKVQIEEGIKGFDSNLKQEFKG
jgi:hypothetical protein